MSASQDQLEPPNLPPNLTTPGLNSKVKGLFVWQGPEFSVFKNLQGLLANPTKCPGIATLLNPVDCAVSVHLNCLAKPSGGAPFHPSCTTANINEASAVTYINSTSPISYLAYSPADSRCHQPRVKPSRRRMRQMNVPQSSVYFDLVDRMADQPSAPGRHDQQRRPRSLRQWVGLNLTKFDEFMARLQDRQDRAGMP